MFARGFPCVQSSRREPERRCLLWSFAVIRSGAGGLCCVHPIPAALHAPPRPFCNQGAASGRGAACGGGCRRQQGCKELGLQEGNSAARSWGLQEAGIARSKQGAASNWDCKKQAGCKKLGLQEANSEASYWGCRKQQWCCIQLGLQEATRVLHATGVARSK